MEKIMFFLTAKAWGVKLSEVEDQEFCIFADSHF